jgi:hypothetical protein
MGVIAQVTPDNRFIQLTDYNELELEQIHHSFRRRITNWRFHPLVKRKVWDGYISFIDKYQRVPIGLWNELNLTCQKYDLGLTVNGMDRVIDYDFDEADFRAWVADFFGDHPKITPRDYQIETAWKIIRFRYSVSEVATSSGKTLIAFMIFAWLKEMGHIRKFMMIVPSTNLVFQGSDDFIDYGIDKLGSRIQQIGGGSKIREGCDVVIGTFQSLVKQDPDFFDEFDLVFVDECLSPDSIITMSDGTYKKISEVIIGDSVLTVNEKSGLLEKREVDFVYVNLNKDKQMYEIETECGKILKVTGNHKVRLKNGEWKKAEDLNYSDELFDI